MARDIRDFIQVLVGSSGPIHILARNSPLTVPPQTSEILGCTGTASQGFVDFLCIWITGLGIDFSHETARFHPKIIRQHQIPSPDTIWANQNVAKKFSPITIRLLES